MVDNSSEMRYNIANKDIIRHRPPFVNGFDEKRDKTKISYKEKEDGMKNGQKKYHRTQPMISEAIKTAKKFAFANGRQQGREGRA